MADQEQSFRVRVTDPARGVDVTVDVPDDEYILDAVEEDGVDLPYDCRVGECTACAGRLVSGSVDQEDQSLLSEGQMRDGFVLICVAYATSDCEIRLVSEVPGVSGASRPDDDPPPEAPVLVGAGQGVPRRRFTIEPSPEPIREPVTKFGGQPVWLGDPHWPTETLQVGFDDQLAFLGQIALDDDLFPGAAGTMVYLFTETDLEVMYDGGVVGVVQRRSPDGDVVTTLPTSLDGATVRCVAAATGPTLFEWADGGQGAQVRTFREYAVRLGPVEHESVVPVGDRYSMRDLDLDRGYRFSRPEVAGNKLGGQPLYVARPTEAPEEFTSDEWLPLLQLAPMTGYYSPEPPSGPNFLPFHFDPGEFGLLTLFVSRDHTRVSCLIQQP